MAKNKVSFTATKLVKKPIVVSFETKSGEIIKFKAVKAVETQVPVKFSTKKKK